MGRLPPYHVRRPRLTSPCRDASVVVVEAAAGYGKTVLGMELADACLVKMAELADDVKVFTTDADFKSYRRKQRNQIPQLSPHIS